MNYASGHLEDVPYGLEVKSMQGAETLEWFRLDHRNRQVRWGFIWALSCAVLWGASYLPGSAIYTVAPFVNMPTHSSHLLAAVVVTILNAIAVLIAMFIWVRVLGKIRPHHERLLRLLGRARTRDGSVHSASRAGAVHGARVRQPSLRR
jgi:hypothetical protein